MLAARDRVWLLQAVTALQARSRELAALVALARTDGDPAQVERRIQQWVASAASGLLSRRADDARVYLLLDAHVGIAAATTWQRLARRLSYFYLGRRCRH